MTPRQADPGRRDPAEADPAVGVTPRRRTPRGVLLSDPGVTRQAEWTMS